MIGVSGVGFSIGIVGLVELVCRFVAFAFIRAAQLEPTLPHSYT